MAQQRIRHIGPRLYGGVIAGVIASAALAACGGGGSGASAPVVAVATASPASVVTTPQPQVVTMSLPDGSAIGQETDPTYGLVGGYTQTKYSQVLGFVTGSQVMISNGQAAAIPHTLDVVSQTSFTTGATPLPTTANGGTTFGAAFASGAINSGASIGPITLATAGIYYSGCGFHFVSDTMRSVLVVAAAATPGPQATPVPGDTPPPNNPGFGY
jgi:hypothetical protein